MKVKDLINKLSHYSMNDAVIISTNGHIEISSSDTVFLHSKKSEEEIEVWLVRDKEGYLLLYSQEPIKYEEYGGWEYIGDYCDFTCLLDFENAFPSIKWENKKPTKVKIILKK